MLRPVSGQFGSIHSSSGAPARFGGAAERPQLRPSCASAVWAVFACACGLASATAASPPQSVADAAVLEIPLRPSAPTLDGRVGSDEWAEAARSGGLLSDDDVSGGLDLWIQGSDDALELAIFLPLADPSALLARAPRTSDEDSLAPLDDTLEVWLAPGDAGGPEQGYRLIFNSRCARWDARYRQDGDDWAVDASGHSPTRIACRLDRRGWTSELAIPWQTIQPEDGDGVTPHLWLRVERQARLPARRSGWPTAAGAPFEHAARIVRRGDAVVLQVRDDQIGVTNRGPTAHDLRLRVDPVDACPDLDDRVLRVEGRARAVVPLTASCGTARSRLRLTAFDGDSSLRGLVVVPASDAPHEKFVVRPVDTTGVRFDSAYYPYFSRLRVRLDPRAARPPLAALRATLRVLAEDGHGIVFEGPVSLSSSAPTEASVALPALVDGGYEVQLLLAAERGEPLVLTDRFDHRTFGWEHNRLGLEDEVIPPFEALRVHGREVSAVLRTHAIGGTGLPEQIRSAGMPLLAEAIRFELVVDGRAVGLEVERAVRFTRTSPTEVAWEAAWSAGPLHGTIEARMEIDGLIELAIELAPSPGTYVERLDLVIPLRRDTALLMNAVTDRARHNFSGAIPRGRGVVWESRQAKRVELTGTFVPYLWLGDEERGLAWFANSTRDWVADGGASVQRIERRDDAVELRVRPIGRRVELAHARRIRFGLQATPTKPRRPGSDWRSWQPYCSAEAPIRTLCILGAGWAWGAATAFGDFSVAAGNEEILEALAVARRTRTVPPGGVEGWLARRVPRHPRPEAVRGGLDYGFRMIALNPDAVIAYTNARYVAPNAETDVYRHEWSPMPFAEEPPPGLEIESRFATFPTRSFQDFAIWNLRRLLDAGVADGFYFDDTYLRAVFDDVSGEAHRDEAGVLHPAVDMMEMRQYLKRMQTLAYRERGEWLNVSHMTNTPIAPIHTWTGAVLDGELRYGPEPFPKRFTRDWIRAESLGSQVGSLPLFLSGVIQIEDEPRRRDVERSVVGATAVHEVRAWAGSERIAKEIWEPLYRFGYGRPGTRVLRYWDEPHAFEVTGVDAEALVLVRDGEALALVNGFGRGGVAELRLDGAGLALAPNGGCAEGDAERDVETVGRFRCRFRVPAYGPRIVVWKAD